MTYLLERHFKQINNDIACHINCFCEREWSNRLKHDNYLWHNIHNELYYNNLWISEEVKTIQSNVIPHSIKLWVGRSEIPCYHWIRIQTLPAY
jgi:hypothetical protein